MSVQCRDECNSFIHPVMKLYDDWNFSTQRLSLFWVLVAKLILLFTGKIELQPTTVILQQDTIMALAQPPGILPLCCKWKDQLVYLFKLDFLVLQIWYIPKASKRGEDCPSQRIHPRTSLSPSIKNTIFSPYFPPNFHVLLGEREALLWLMLAIVLTSFNRPENTKYQLSRPPPIWSVGLSVVTWEMQSALFWGQLNLLLNP